MKLVRRAFLQRAVAGLATVMGSMLLPNVVLAAWPAEAFKRQAKLDEVLTNLFNKTEHTESADITVKAPEIAENGRMVQIKVTTSISNIKSISIIVPNNPVPLIAQFNMTKNATGMVATRIKMGKTGPVMAVVEDQAGALFSASKEVKITIGGCGG